MLLKKFNLDPEQVWIVIQDIKSNCLVNAINVETIQKALEIKKIYGFSYYDSLIIAAALENECVLLLTEDLQNGQKIENTLIIKNVFD